MTIPLAQPAVAAPPTVNGVAPQLGGTGGGYPIRIYGDGFNGTISAVQIDGMAATSFAKIDDDLITAVVPGGGTNNDFVDVAVTDNEGTDTLVDAFLYTNATLALSPSTGLDAGDPVTLTLDGYVANEDIVVPELNPLQIYYEGEPEFPPVPPAFEPPYVDTLAFDQTNGSGDYSDTVNLADRSTSTGRTSIHGRCAGSTRPRLTSSATARRRVMTNRHSPGGACSSPPSSGRAASRSRSASAPTVRRRRPVFTTDTASAGPGATVTITSGSNWNANPFYGSSKPANKPGETKVFVEICGIGGVDTACSTTKGNGKVAMTRYIDQAFSGATLTGTIVIGADADNCSTCFVRVRQNRPLSGRIEATVPLNVT